jgi:hypothetical protein
MYPQAQYVFMVYLKALLVPKVREISGQRSTKFIKGSGSDLNLFNLPAFA